METQVYPTMAPDYKFVLFLCHQMKYLSLHPAIKFLSSSQGTENLFTCVSVLLKLNLLTIKFLKNQEQYMCEDFTL